MFEIIVVLVHIASQVNQFKLNEIVLSVVRTRSLCRKKSGKMVLFVSTPLYSSSQRHRNTANNKRCALTPGLPTPRRRTFLAAASLQTWRMSADSVSENVAIDIESSVKELLGRMKKCSLYFVGPMGSGKSAVGKYIAHQLEFRFLDTDELIELFAKKDITSIFETDGENAFRALETAVLDQVQAFIGCCVATGGGIVMDQGNWGKLQTGIVVFLDAPVDVLVKRLEGDKTRPLLQGAESLSERIESILEKRRGMYEQADVVVHIGEDDAVEKVGAEVVRKLNNFIKENPPRLSKLYSTISHLSKEEEA